ncbi:MAG TPA: potassium channel family protein [Pseudomonadales bacterium]|nr:potassium channel family protein [Pseudomonadales bacterium]
MRRPGRSTRFKRFVSDVVAHTPVARMVLILVALWLLFSAGILFAERGAPGTDLHTFGDALYWSVAAFSTAGIADTPATGLAKLIGGIWIVIGSLLFFGTIVATVTGYFMRPLQRPHRQIIDTIEFNLEQLGTLDLEELDLLKDTVNTLIEHVERIRASQRAAAEQS